MKSRLLTQPEVVPVCAPSVIQHVSTELSRRRSLQAAGAAAAAFLLPWHQVPAQAAPSEAVRSLSFTHLADLATVPLAGATLIAAAPKVQGASGGPLRVLAVW